MKQTGCVPCALLLASVYITRACERERERERERESARAVISSFVMMVFVTATHSLIETELLNIV